MIGASGPQIRDHTGGANSSKISNGQSRLSRPPSNTGRCEKRRNMKNLDKPLKTQIKPLKSTFSKLHENWYEDQIEPEDYENNSLQISNST